MEAIYYADHGITEVEEGNKQIRICTNKYRRIVIMTMMICIILMMNS